MPEHDFTKYPELTNAQLDVLYFVSPHKQITEDFRAKVTKVADGDTVRLRWSERDFDFPLRLMGIQAPEMNMEGGKESKQWLEGQVLGKTVDIIINPKFRVEKWGRLLGKIQHLGLDIGEMSMAAGMSVPWEQREDGLMPNFNWEMSKHAII